MKKYLSIVMFLAAFACAASVVVPFSPKAGGAFKLSSGGKLTRVEAFSPVSGGTFDLKSVYSADVYTNAVSVKTATNVTYTVVESNAYTHVVSTNSFHNLSFVDDPGIVGVSTNIAVVATTNAWPVLKETVVVTNDIASGTQTGYKLEKNLDAPKYLAPGERLIFSGTGVGGFVRLIFE